MDNEERMSRKERWRQIRQFAILEDHDLGDGFWGTIKLVNFRDGTTAYMIDIWIAPPNSANYGTGSFREYSSLEEARTNLNHELLEARAKGLRSTKEGGKVGQPIFLTFENEDTSGQNDPR